MKILSLIGSRRKRGNSAYLAARIAEAAAEVCGAETEELFLGDYCIKACTGCEGCSTSWECVIKDDYQRIIERIDTADAVILVSPTYWYSVTSDMKRFIDRSYSLIQYPENRQQWIGKYRESGKFCVSAAVCEQFDERMMGNTLSLLSDFARDIGLKSVDSLKALGFFEAGSIAGDPAIAERARKTGRRLGEALVGPR